MPDLLTSIDTDLLRRLLALALLGLGALAFVTTPGGRRRWLLGLRRFRPKSQHWPVTLGLMAALTLTPAWLLWPGAPGKGWIVAGLLALLAGELALRLRPPRAPRELDLSTEETLYSSRLYQPHHYTLFEPRPDIRAAGGLAHNRLGLRDHRSLHPDPRAIRLVFLGGPVVYGVTTRDNAAVFTSQLEARLNSVYRDRLGERTFEVINAGMANATTAELLLRQIFAVSELQPALIALQAGICDTWPRIIGDGYRGDFGGMRKRWGHGPLLLPSMSVAESLARALVWRSALLNRWLGRRVPAEPLLNLTNRANHGRGDRLAQNPPVHFERNLRYMLALTGEMRALPLLIGDPIPVGPSPEGLYQRAVPEHNAVMARLASERQVPFLDLGAALPLTDDIRDRDKYLNQAGQQRLAGLLADILEQSGLIDRLLTCHDAAERGHGL